MRKNETDDVLELLRQLRARLLQWRAEADPLLRGQTPGKGIASRRLRIEQFIRLRHGEPAPVRDLARDLSLTESRTIHLVREIFGTSYVKLLTEARLRTAASLLRETSLSILEVGLRSGFSDLSHFHRFFRRRFGVTPGRYRSLAPA